MPRVKIPFMGFSHGLPRVLVGLHFSNGQYATGAFLVDSGTQFTLVAKATWGKCRVRPKLEAPAKTILGIGGFAKHKATPNVTMMIRGGAVGHVYSLPRVYLNEDEKLKVSCLGADFLRAANAVVHLDYGVSAMSCLELDTPVFSAAATGLERPFG